MYFNCSLLIYFMSLYVLYLHLFGHKLLPAFLVTGPIMRTVIILMATESIWLIVVNDWSNWKKYIVGF